MDITARIENVEKKPAFFIYVLMPMVIFSAYLVSAAHPLLYVMTFLVYYPSVNVALKFCRVRIILIVLILVAGLIACSRAHPVKKHLNVKDSTICSVFRVKSDESVEQDFFLPRSDWRLSRLMSDKNVDAVIRILGDIKVENSRIYLNGLDLGDLAPLLVNKPEPYAWYGFPVHNYVFKIPKEALGGMENVTIRIVSPDGFSMAYSSGLHPLPRRQHCRLIKADGSVEDISDRYYNRRFRFQSVIYFISKKYVAGKDDRFLSKDDPLILGALL